MIEEKKEEMGKQNEKGIKKVFCVAMPGKSMNFKKLCRVIEKYSFYFDLKEVDVRNPNNVGILVMTVTLLNFGGRWKIRYIHGKGHIFTTSNSLL